MKRILSVSIFFAILWTAPLGAQGSTSHADSARAERLHRDPRIAQVLGLLPGIGHLYAGEYSRWYFTQVTVVSSLAMGEVFLKSEGCMFGGSCSRSSKRTDRVLGAGMIALGAWLWISSARDAPRAAARANDRHARKTRAISPFVEPAVIDNVKVNVGVAVRW